MADRRLRIAVAVLLLAAIVGAALLILRGGDGGASIPPPVAAAKLVPADALVFADLAIEPGRPATRRVQALAAQFPSYPALRDALVAPDVRAWAGGEVALALFRAGRRGTASLVLVEVGDRAGAARYVAAHATGALVAAVAGSFVAIGPAAVVRRAIALASGAAGVGRAGGGALAANAAYRRAVAPLPAGRVLTAWATTTGVRRLLAPQSGVLGVLGGLLDRPGLRGVGVAAGPDDTGAALTAHWLLDPAVAAKIETFTPTLVERVPANAAVVLGSHGLTGSLGRLLGLTSASTTDTGLSALLGEAAQGLADRSRGSLRAGVLGLLSGESIAYVVPGVPRPTLTIVARSAGQLGTEAALAALRPSVARVLAQPNAAGTKRVPATWRSRGVDGVTVWTLPFAKGSEIDYAVADGRLVVSTSLAGLRSGLRPTTSITDTARWRAVMRNLRNPVGSLVFLDFNQLLRLGEQTGLDDSREYQRVRDDLQQIRAVGSIAVPGAGESTAEILLQIP